MSAPRITSFVAPAVLVALLATPRLGAQTPPAPAAPALTAVQEEVRALELAFAASVMENRPEQFAAYIDEGAVFVSGGGVTRGREKIVAAWSVFFAGGRPYFEWHPETVEISRDGTLGLTRGPWTIRSQGADGKVVEQTGLFNSIWQRQPDGGWKVVFDAGCSPCPACGS